MVGGWPSNKKGGWCDYDDVLHNIGRIYPWSFWNRSCSWTDCGEKIGVATSEQSVKTIQFITRIMIKSIITGDKSPKP